MAARPAASRDLLEESSTAALRGELTEYSAANPNSAPKLVDRRIGVDTDGGGARSSPLNVALPCFRSSAMSSPAYRKSALFEALSYEFGGYKEDR